MEPQGDVQEISTTKYKKPVFGGQESTFYDAEEFCQSAYGDFERATKFAKDNRVERNLLRKCKLSRQLTHWEVDKGAQVPGSFLCVDLAKPETS